MRKKGRENTDFIRELNVKIRNSSKNCTKRMDEIRHLKIAEFPKERKQLADKMETKKLK